jgi:hypothetical protein
MAGASLEEGCQQVVDAVFVYSSEDVLSFGESHEDAFWSSQVG